MVSDEWSEPQLSTDIWLLATDHRLPILALFCYIRPESALAVAKSLTLCYFLELAAEFPLRISTLSFATCIPVAQVWLARLFGPVEILWKARLVRPALPGPITA